MEAKVQNMIRMTDEMDFFTLIEKKMEDQGFEVLETLPPERLFPKRTNDDKSRFIHTGGAPNRFAY